MSMPVPYRYLVRRPGYRGRTVAHLTTPEGEAVCGLRLGERWELARATRRPLCRRCQQVAQAEQISDLLGPFRTMTTRRSA
jgi:hypothetical protein